jgi:branched-chain amino acid transport system ATP-binding protein
MAEFLLVTVLVFGGGGFMMGQALADTWRPVWHSVPYGLMMTAANRFIDVSLFQGTWAGLQFWLGDAVVIIGLANFAYRITLARKMVSQYPWLYERSGLFSWRERAS